MENYIITLKKLIKKREQEHIQDAKNKTCTWKLESAQFAGGPWYLISCCYEVSEELKETCPYCKRAIQVKN